jgi:cysteine desulfurase/selenocysteine lyase
MYPEAQLDIAHLPALARVRERIVGIDRRVPVLDGSLRSYVNFDNAASTPVLREVLDTVNGFMEWYSSVHRGTGFKSRVATQAFDDAREIVAEFVGANRNDHVVIFGKNTSESINKLSYRFPFEPDDVVLVSLLEHHSNDLPWRARARVEHIGADAFGRLDEADFDRLLAKHAGRVKLVAITGGANVTGCMPDIHRLAEKAHAAGAQILVDCAQLAPHRSVEMGALDDPSHLDYVALSAHKMYAPFGTGALIGRRDTFDQGEPEYRGGGTIDFVGIDSVAWAAAPDRDEAGSPNVVGAVALAAATKALKSIGMDGIARHEADLTAYALKRLAEIDGVHIYGDADSQRTTDRLGVIPFNVGHLSHFLVAAILGTEYGIGVRNGCFCAHPYLAHLLGMTKDDALKVGASIATRDLSGMPGMVRISFGMYNTIEEVDVLIEALSDIARGAHKGKYVQDGASGEYQAQGWSPDLAAYFELRAFVPATCREEAREVRSLNERVSARRTLRLRGASLAA